MTGGLGRVLKKAIQHRLTIFFCFVELLIANQYSMHITGRLFGLFFPKVKC